VGCGREGGSANGIVFGAGPESKNDEIGMMILPPERIADVLLRNPENRRDGRFRISDFGMGTGIWDGTWFGRRMHDKVGVAAKITESFCQKAEIAMPEELFGADGEVGVEKDFQETSGWGN